jgi:hypothetical protein
MIRCFTFSISRQLQCVRNLPTSTSILLSSDHSSTQHQRRFLSSVDSPVDAEEAAKLLKLNAAVLSQKPHALFPWRHETSDNLLPRLRFDSPEYRADVRLPSDIQSILAAFFLNVPVWKVLIGTSWRDELAEACAFAFAQGTAGILSNVYKLQPFGSVKSVDDGKINFQYPEADVKEPATEHEIKPDEVLVNAADEQNADGQAEKQDENISKADDNTKAKPEDKASNDNDDHSASPDVMHMLDRPLRRLFQSAHESGRDQLIIKLRSEPKRALLYTIFGIPSLTKAAAEADTSLLNRIRGLLALLREDPDTAFAGINDFVLQNSPKHMGKVTTTIEMQVLVECDEEFQVLDRATGALLQGSEDGLVRTVMHLVRLETNVTWKSNFPSLPRRTQDDWVITDIDDLVGPLKWYHKH